MRFTKASLITLSAIVVSINSVSAKSLLKTYNNSSEKYSITYPDHWQQEEYKNEGYSFIVFKSPLSDENDNFSENMNIVVENAKGYKVNEYLKSAFDIIQSSNTLKDFKILEQGDVKINKRNGKYIVYTHTYDNFSLKVKAYVACNGKKCFVLTGTATHDTYEGYKLFFDKIASSFKY